MYWRPGWSSGLQAEEQECEERIDPDRGPGASLSVSPRGNHNPVAEQLTTMRRMTTSVVTGGAGFLGSHLCDYLIEQGQRVICVDNLETGSLENIEHLGDDVFKFVYQDVVDGIWIDEPVDFVYHLASPASPIDYLRLPLQTLKVGSQGTHNALGLAKWKRARFLISSTSEVYGDPQVHPQPETYWGNVNPIGPRGVYDEAKRYAEALTMAYHNQQGVNTAIARIFNTYGPRMRRNDGRATVTFLHQALEGKPLTVFGEGSQTRSLCYVDDLIRGLYLLADVRRAPAGQHRQPGPRGDDAAARRVVHPAHRLVEPDRLRGAADRRPDASGGPTSRRPRQVLGWEPEVDLDEGLRRWVRSLGHEPSS